MINIPKVRKLISNVLDRETTYVLIVYKHGDKFGVSSCGEGGKYNPIDYVEAILMAVSAFFEKCNEGEIAAMTSIPIQGIHGIAEEELNARKNR